jgi:hypothetical protein
MMLSRQAGRACPNSDERSSERIKSSLGEWIHVFEKNKSKEFLFVFICFLEDAFQKISEINSTDEIFVKRFSKN